MTDETNQPAAPTTSNEELSALLREALAQRPAATPNKLTLGLAGALLLGLGFAGGLAVDGRDGHRGPDHMIIAEGTMVGPGGGPRSGHVEVGPMGGPGMGPGNVTIGKVQSVDGTTLTIKTIDGDTVKAKVGSKTDISVTKSGSVNDFSKGDEVIVNGERDGNSVDAEFISKAPEPRFHHRKR